MDAPNLHETELTNWAIDLVGVKKTYARRVHALRGVNVQVGRGEIFGLLGPNGAGKSTLVKIMMTVVHADKAMGTILGRPIGNRRKLAAIGYLPEDLRVPGYLTGRQVLDYFGALASVSAPDRQKRAGELLDRLSMSQWADTRVREYSKGMLRRLGMAQALVNDPDLLVLDEPTDGIDPVGRRDVRLLLTELRAAGKTIFLNSHLLSELEMVCDRVTILNEGLVVRQGTLTELTEHTVQYRITTSDDLTGISKEIDGLGGRREDGGISIGGRDAKKVNELIDLLRSNNILIESVEPHRFSLEDIFVEVLGANEVNSRAPAARPLTP